MNTESYLKTEDKQKCCGCRSCEQKCPVDAITMKEDNEGFLYPETDSGKCINCGACFAACPYTNNISADVPDDIYSFQLSDKSALSNSSSGGVFYALAKHCIDNSGVVYGCVFDKDFQAKINRAESLDDIYPMQGSKYVSSDTCASYSDAENNLKAGKMVLYTGTPCQIAGLVSYLKNDYPNLITMDFLCHGVPSYKLFDSNIKYLEDKHNGKVLDYKFRDKKKAGWGIRSSYVVNNRYFYESARENLYFNCFIDGLANRYSCYSCDFRGGKRKSDITVGDFWGYKMQDIDSRKGVSFIQLNNNKAKKLFEELKCGYSGCRVSHSDVAEQNSTLINETKETIPDVRCEIYNQIEALGFETCAKKYFYPSNMLLLKIKKHIPDFIKNIIKKMS